MADTTATIPEVAAPAATEQTAATEPVAAPGGGEAADEAKPAADASKEDIEKPEGELMSIARTILRRARASCDEVDDASSRWRQRRLVAQRTRPSTNAC